MAVSPPWSPQRLTLRAKLATDAKGPEDLMEISYLLSNYTLTVQLRSTMLKEQTDTMKGVIQKI